MSISQIEAIPVLQQLIQGLLFPSETDKPFDVVTFDDGSKNLKEQVLSRLGMDKAKSVDEVSLEDQFEGLFDGPDGGRFRKIQSFFNESLAPVTVLRVGQIEIDIFILGKSSDDKSVGLHTRSVET